MIKKTFDYMINDWDNLIKYRKDGRYTLDNMSVEKAVNPIYHTQKTPSSFAMKKVWKLH